MIRTHHLKILAEYFDSIACGDKTFEIRKNDRGFQKGDIVYLHEIKSGFGDFETGRSIIAQLGYVTNFEQKDGYCVFSLLDVVIVGGEV